jgi:diacylglycerol kinase (ATP)
VKTLFVVNPAAGHGRGLARFEAAAKGLPQGAWEARTTRCRGDGARVALQGLEAGFSAVVAVGGDGTAGEVLNGFMSAPERLRAGACMGTWPAGSGCDLARHFGVRGDAAGLKAVLAAEPRPIDAGVVEFEAPDGTRQRLWFVNVASFGVAGEVARRMDRTGKPLGGTLSYLVGALGALMTEPPRDMELIADGAPLPPGRYHLVAVANTSTTGGGMKIAPAADAEDGRLDIVTVGDVSRPELLKRFFSVYRGEHLNAPGVGHRLARRLEARSGSNVYLNIDGEAVGRLPAVFETLPKAVPFLVPAPRA